MVTKDVEEFFAASVGPIVFRLVWWNHLDPTKRGSFADDLLDAIMLAVVQLMEVHLEQRLPEGAAHYLKPRVQDMLDAELGSYSDYIHEFGNETYEKTVARLLERREESNFFRAFASQHDLFTDRIANLSDELITAVTLLNEEFVIWLKTHKGDMSRIHPDAFEQLTGELLAHHGFEVQFTGRLRNRSADIIAIEKSEDGEVVKYLIECKRYAERRKVGVNILNAVVGASFRAKISHAMLVTTSSFTSDAFVARAELEEFRLDLHDGQKVTEWLADYDFKDFGLWLPEGWQDKWTPR